MKKTNKKGFTLVELVIVIAVIAILAAVLIPVFSNLIGRANESAALQNARNEYTAYTLAVATDGNIPVKDCVIVSGGYNFEVKDGELQAKPIDDITDYNAEKDLTKVTVNGEEKDMTDCNSEIIIYAKNESTGG